MRIVIIGSAAAGVPAASRIAHGDRNAQITVYEKSPFFSCGSCGLPHYLGNPKSDLAAAINRKSEELKREGVDARLCHEVVDIDPVRKQLTVCDLSLIHI